MSVSQAPQQYLYGKGRVSIAERDGNGGVSKVLYLGNCPELKISGSAEKLDHYESQSGLNTKDRSIVKTSAMDVSVTLESMTQDNLALLLWGNKRTIASAAAQSHFFPTGIVAGETHIIPNAFNITTPVLKDSTGSPVTVPTTKYEIDPTFGVVKFLDVATYTQPFELEYDNGAAKAVPIFSGSQPARFLRFEGLNIGNPGSNVSQKFLVELYLCTFEPVADLSLIGDDFGKFELKGSLNQDETRLANADLGGYGRIVEL
jgi:hypothetical protein